MAYPEAEVPAETDLGVVPPENTRREIAMIAVGGLFLTLLVIVVGGWLITAKTIDDTLKVLTTAMGTLTGIAGAIIGYYFRSDA